MSELVCVHGHDRCAGGTTSNCPYCEWRPGPPKKWKSPRVCPRCGDRSTKIYSLSTGLYRCQCCDHRYAGPDA